MKEWGTAKSGRLAHLFAIRGAGGAEAVVSDFGASLISFEVSDSDGTKRQILLGYDSVSSYEVSDTFFGALIARNANRIENARFSLDGHAYTLDQNDGTNNLHSGADTLAKRIWQLDGRTENSVTFSIDSPDGDMGFPGNMHLTASYTLTKHNALVLDISAESDMRTIFNPTFHGYFNLDGDRSKSIASHKLKVYADSYTPVNDKLIPTGECISVAGTCFDFTKEKTLQEALSAPDPQIAIGAGVDHNFCIRREKSEKSGLYSDETDVFKDAELISPDHKRTLTVYSDLPGLQIYTGNYVSDNPIGRGDFPYGKNAGIAMEPQFYPNAINQPTFAQPVIEAGKRVSHRMVYEYQG